MKTVPSSPAEVRRLSQALEEPTWRTSWPGSPWRP